MDLHVMQTPIADSPSVACSVHESAALDCQDLRTQSVEEELKITVNNELEYCLTMKGVNNELQ